MTLPSVSLPKSALALAMLVGGCADDTVENPFDTEGASSSGTGTATETPDPSTGPSVTGGVDDTSSTGSPGTTIAIDDSGTSSGTTLVAESSSSAGDEDTSSSSSGGESSSSGEESSSSDGGSENLPCPAGMFDTTTLPTTVMGSSSGEDSEFAGTCGGNGAPDIAFMFTAPFDGSFIFDTFGSTFDTVVYVLDGECGGAQLVCNDDGIGTTTLSAASVELLAGQTVTVVVDAFGLSGGNVTLTAREGNIECPIDIDSTVPQTIAGDTIIATDDFFGTCGLGASPDTEYLFEPTVAGTYTFEITNNDFDTVVFVLDGVCTGTELICNDNLNGSLTGASGVAVPLSAGQPVTVVVDGSFDAFGTYDLNIGMLDGTCPDEDLGGMVPPFTVSGTTAGGDNASAGSCGGLGSADHSYTWTAPFEASYRFDTGGSAFDTVVYVQDSSCVGTELGCSNDTGVGNLASATAHLVAGQDVVITVDGSGAEGAFDLTVDVECPAQDLGSTVPQTISDQTIVADDEFFPSCGTGGGQDQGFTFTAPANGTYTFETLNVTFDTVMSVLDGTCAGVELACNDNLDPLGGTGESGLALGLAAGQTVTIVVEGFFGATGTFDLAVGQLIGTCPDEDLGGMVPPFTVMGSTAGEDNANAGSCGGLSSADYSYTWTSPLAGTFRFDTTGSAYDTVVYVLDASCVGPELNCSNDASGTPQGNTAATLAAGQEVVIVVDGNGAEGNFTLDVYEGMDSGNCCVSHAAVGCDDPVVEACVCALDSFCCNVSWDGLCVDEAINLCGAICI